MTDQPSWKYEHEMRVWEANRELFGVHLEAVCNFAKMAITSIVLANSASAGAVLAYIAGSWKDASFASVFPAALDAVGIFAVGIFAAILAAALSYVAQYSYMQADMMADPAKPDQIRPKIWGCVGLFAHIIAFGSAFVGLYTFGRGAWKGYIALKGADAGPIFDLVVRLLF